MKKLCRYISEYMGVLVLAAALLALAFPRVLQQVPTAVINYLLGVVMFGMGLTLNLQDFKIVFSRPRDVMAGSFQQLQAWCPGCTASCCTRGISRRREANRAC